MPLAKRGRPAGRGTAEEGAETPKPLRETVPSAWSIVINGKLKLRDAKEIKSEVVSAPGELGLNE